MVGEEGFFKGIENRIATSVVSENFERSTLDKAIAKDDVQTLRLLMKKPRWEKGDIFEASYLLTANEAKLWDLDAWERYIGGKFFVWLREFLSVEEEIINYQNFLKDNDVNISADALGSLEQSRLLMENINKSGIDCFSYVTRTSLSIGGTGFRTLTTNNYELIYPQQTTNVQQNERKGILSNLTGR